jgi:hypothetical protein
MPAFSQSVDRRIVHSIAITFHADHWPFPPPSLFVLFLISGRWLAYISRIPVAFWRMLHTFLDLLAELGISWLSF